MGWAGTYSLYGSQWGGGVRIAYLFGLSVQLQPVFKSYSEIMDDRRVWGWTGTCSLKDIVNGVVVLE